ncbi:MAG: hypothetical protein EPO24_08870 [Bacteroidetes bacterium]|nr:MAG: hypothetical protein EPO24_08870 [Bacteroidota bacterium]
MVHLRSCYESMVNTSFRITNSLKKIVYYSIFFCSFQVTFSQDTGKSSAEIRGTITVPKNNEVIEDLYHKRALNRYAKHHGGVNKTPKPYSLSEQCVIYIESAPQYSSSSERQRRAELDQSDLMFRPLVLPVLVGTTVDFPNRDELYHNVFSYSSVKEFDLGRYPKNQVKSVTFDKAGTVQVFCDIHTYMFATILVLDNPWFTTPSEDGSYVLSNVPPGTYQISVWYLRKKVDTKTVTVKENQALVVNFEL